MDKTIKQIADEIGVSKSAIRKLLTPDFRNEYTHLDANRILINSEGQALIQKQFESKTHTENAHDTHSERTQETHTDLFAVSVLQEQLKVKDQQINELHRLLLAEQQKNQQIEQIAAPKKHWWSFFRQK